jgi:predicted thioesterase
MKHGLEGKSAELEVLVTPEMCPHFDGALVHPVYATWTMVNHMEVAGRKLILPYLEPDEEAVGAHIRVDHRSPATIGARVIVTAVTESATPHRLTCRTVARCGERIIGEGVFVQVVMPKERLQGLLDRHRG